MKKDYNQFTKSDIPLDASLTPSSTNKQTTAKQTKPKINAIGTKAKQQTTKNVSTSNKKDDKKSQRAKDLDDLSKLNEENIRSHSFRSKRNQVIVALLSVLLAIAIAFIVIYLTVTKVENNCFAYIHGDVDASYVIDGKEISEFRAPANIRGECILNLKVDLKINSSNSYNVKFIILCYNGSDLLSNVVVYEPNTTGAGFTYKNDGYYYSKSTIQGSQTISLCQGIALNETDLDINDDNFKLEIHTYFERA